MGAKAEADFHEPDKGITVCMVACFEAGKAACCDMDLNDRTEDIAVAAVSYTHLSLPPVPMMSFAPKKLTKSIET